MILFRPALLFLFLSLQLPVSKAQDQEECTDSALCTIPQFSTYCTHPTYRDRFLELCPKFCKVCVDSNSANDARCSREDNGGCEHLCTIQNNQVKCDCFAGFQLQPNGIHCTDTNECLRDPCRRQTLTPHCINRVGTFFCSSQNCSLGDSGFLNRYQSEECCRNVPDAQCGRDLTSGDARVVGGQSAVFGAWPWMVYILIDNRVLCGGTLISLSWVVTAGHCFREANANSTVTMYFGRLKPQRFEPQVQQREAVEIILHENWNKERFPYHDIALLRLSSPVNRSDAVDIACLPNGERPRVGTQCWVTGYGTTAFRGSAAEDLQEVDLIIQDMNQCKNSYRGTQFPIRDNIMFCAGHAEGGKDSCQGDSGGPLVCQRCESCQWYLAGIVSFGRGCARPNFFGVYTDVEHYESWISQHTGIPFNKNKRCEGAPTAEWSRWMDWTQCTQTCGGTRMRSRRCINGNTGDPGCQGDTEESENCNTDCATGSSVWSEWSQWSDCSMTCGQGQRLRVRSCRNENSGGAGCQGRSQEHRACNTQTCPTWSDYGLWSACSESCGGGTRLRVRSCVGGSPGDVGCHEGSENETMNCNTHVCDSWSRWDPWSSCSVSCGAGMQSSNRRCSGGVPGQGGCIGDAERTRLCSTNQCPTWSTWSEYTGCSLTCGGGFRTRARVCLNGNPGDPGCDGNEDEREACSTQPCPVFTIWSSWTNCSAPCGTGQRSRRRSCRHGVVGDEGCQGRTQMEENCNSRICPSWSQYGAWSECSTSCGGGNQTAIRTCINQFPEGGGCEGPAETSRRCNTEPCPFWESWIPQGECSRSCDRGEMVETRLCRHGIVGQAGCEGNSTRIVSCQIAPCPSAWSEWSMYGSCSASCGGGTRNRTRICMGGLNPSCPGDAVESQPCGEEPCSTRWSQWREWTECSKTCSGGLRTRNRECLDGEAGDPGCFPANLQSHQEICNSQNCPGCSDKENVVCSSQFCQIYFQYVQTNCQKTCGLCRSHQPWGQWSVCSTTCGGGFQQRSRICLGFGVSCFGSPEEMRACNTDVECSGFSPWGNWSPCNASCNSGTRSRTRVCPPGIDCRPDQFGSALVSTELCQTNSCPGVWGAWGEYNDCSRTCGGGSRMRTRSCVGGEVGATGCEGLSVEESPCNTTPCPGVWGEWTQLGNCSVTCGDGIQNERRECIGGSSGGPGCEGPAMRQINCTRPPCVTQWLDWGNWGECSASCGNGSRTRSRLCDNGAPGDVGCEGNSTETQACNTSPCQRGMQCSSFTDLIHNCNILRSSCSIPEHQAFMQANCRRTCCEVTSPTSPSTGLCQDRPIPNGLTCVQVLFAQWCGQSWARFYCSKACGFCQ